MSFHLSTLLNQNNFQTYNRAIANKIGLVETILLHALIGKFEQTKFSDGLTDTGEFYYMIDDCQEDTAVKAKSQRTALDNLAKMGLITYGIKGLPPRRYFLLHFDKIYEMFDIQINSTNLADGRFSKRRKAQLETPKGVLHHIYNTKDNTKEKTSQFSQKTPTPQEAFELAKYLFEKLHAMFPKIKAPNLEEWAKHVRLMHERDNRSWEEIKKVIDFAMDDTFWCRNILSTQKLRAQFDKLLVKMTPVVNKGTLQEKCKEIAMDVKNYLNSIGRKNNLQIFKTKCYIGEINEEIMFEMNPEEFEKILLKTYNIRKNE